MKHLIQIKIVDEVVDEILCFALYRTPEFILIFLVIKLVSS